MSRNTHNKYIEVQSLLKMIPNRVLYAGNIKNNRINFEENKNVTVIGTVKKYTGATKKKNKQIYIKNCMAE